MEYKKIYIKDICNFDVGNDSYVEIYLNTKNYELNIEPRLPMIVIPGGGYNYCSPREAEPVALRYMAEGFNCFVLNYSCNVPFPRPHFELAALVDYLKKNEEALNIKANYFSMVGFSAGGHLASSFALIHNKLEKDLGFEKDYLKPFSLVLSYPVTSLILGTNSETRKVITNEGIDELVNLLTVPENVTKDYPPTYIWSTYVDECVPVAHSINLAKALEQHNVPHKLSIFDNGIHGGSLCNRAVYNLDVDFDSISKNKCWIDESVDFIYKLF